MCAPLNSCEYSVSAQARIELFFPRTWLPAHTSSVYSISYCVTGKPSAIEKSLKASQPRKLFLYLDRPFARFFRPLIAASHTACGGKGKQKVKLTCFLFHFIPASHDGEQDELRRLGAWPFETRSLRNGEDEAVVRNRRRQGVRIAAGSDAEHPAAVMSSTERQVDINTGLPLPPGTPAGVVRPRLTRPEDGEQTAVPTRGRGRGRGRGVSRGRKRINTGNVGLPAAVAGLGRIPAMSSTKANNISSSSTESEPDLVGVEPHKPRKKPMPKSVKKQKKVEARELESKEEAERLAKLAKEQLDTIFKSGGEAAESSDSSADSSSEADDESSDTDTSSSSASSNSESDKDDKTAKESPQPTINY